MVRCAAAGSHKASLRLYDENQMGLSGDPGPLFESGHLKHVEMDAGDVVLFLGGTQTHGVLTWNSDVDRRGVLYSVWSRSFERGLRAML